MAVTTVRKYRVEIHREVCKGCRLCVEFCPKDVLAMSADRLNSKGVPFAECVRPAQCVGCLACTTVCPDAAIELFERED
jgi:2-oxoglutarate ferredoxin oxidoreductase subunit delta